MVTSATMYYYDTSSSNCTGFFTIYDRQNATIVTEWTMSSSGSGGAGSATAVLDHTIDNSQYAYAVNWRPGVEGGAIQLRGFQLTYTLPPGTTGTVVIPLY